MKADFFIGLEHAHNLFCVCHGDRIVRMNATGRAILGMGGEDEPLGKSIFDFFHKDYSDFADLGLEVFAEDTTLLSLKLVRADGQEVDMEMWVNDILFEDKPAFLIEARDITAHIRAATDLRTREQRLVGIINTVADGIISVDNKGSICSFNPGAERIFGFKSQEILGQNIKKLLPSETEDLLTDFVGADWARTFGANSETTGLRKDGETFDAEVAVSELRQGDDLSFTSIIRDITTRKKAEDYIRHLAHHDNLTGLPNRHLFGDRLDESVKRARRAKTRVGVMFIDLDKFKPINDTLGHAAGDEVLKTVSSRLKVAVRSTDTVARVGGDEFVVILEGLHDIGESELVARKVLKHLAVAMDILDNQCHVGASIGIAVFPDHADSVESMLHCADLAMYAVKEAGRNNFKVYEKAP